MFVKYILLGIIWSILSFVLTIYRVYYQLGHFSSGIWEYFDGLEHERRNSIANALELRLSCTNPSIYTSSYHMMTSSNGDIFRVTGHLCGEFTGQLWIPHSKANDAELWCFLWSAHELTVE